MAPGFDELVARLLYDVALAGTGGLGIAELGDAVREFYSQSTTISEAPLASTDEDLLFSEVPPAAQKQTVDDSLIELAWHWLSKNAEVEVRVVDADEVSEQVDGEALSPQLAKYANQRLATGEDRVWYAITGHGIDTRRIPPLEFEALSVIASFGAKGVLQPQVTRITGQDKRSLPKRTDNLARNGYIIKESVIALSTRTSMLKLKKYATAEVAEPEELMAEHGTIVIQYDRWFDGVIRALKENNNVMAFEDVRLAIGIAGKQYETRALARCIRRLATVGCIRKVTAREERDDAKKSRNVRSLQLLREPNATDRLAFMRSEWKSKQLIATADGTRQAADELDEDEDADGEYDDEKDGLQPMSKRDHPLWTPDIPFANFLFNCINDAGRDGTNSAELYGISIGDFWKRASDEMLMKVSDLWYSSQPPHLRHFAIVRDLGQHGKQSVFQYRTHENFQKAVEQGDTFWDAVIAPEVKNKAAKKKAQAAAVAEPDLDAWAFPKISPKLLVGQHGAATLQECLKAAPATVVPKAREFVLEPTNGNVLRNPPRNYNQAPVGQSTVNVKRVQRRLANEEIEYAVSVRGLAERRATAEFNSRGITPVPVQAAAPVPDTSPVATSLPQPATPVVRTPTVLRVPKLDVLLFTRQKRDDAAATLQAHLASQTPTGPKKRGRPTKAMFAERERAIAEKAKLQQEADATNEELSAFLSVRDVDLLGRDFDDAEELFVDITAQPPVQENIPTPNQNLFVDTSTQLPVQADGTTPETPLPSTAAQATPPPAVPTPAPIEVQVDSPPAVRPSPVNNSAALEARIQEIEADLLARTKPGVYLNPPGSQATKAEYYSSTGRPRKAKIAVIKSERLKAFPWFTTEEARVAPPATAHRTSVVERYIDQPKRVWNRKKSLPVTKKGTTRGAGGVTQANSPVKTLQTAGIEFPAARLQKPASSDPITRIMPDMIGKGTPVGGDGGVPIPPFDPVLQEPIVPSVEDATTNVVGPESDASVHDPMTETVVQGPKTSNLDASANSATTTQTVAPNPNTAVATLDARDATVNSSVTDEDLPAIRDVSQQIDPDTLAPVIEGSRKGTGPLRLRTQKGVSEKVGAIHTKRRELVMSILETCGGVFPGKNEMWYPFASGWQAQTGATPDKVTVESLLKGMVTTGKLKKLTFTFQSKKGFIVERAILALPSVDSAAPKVRMLQRRIIDSFPAAYVPDGVFISPELRTRLANSQAMHNGKSSRKFDTPGEDDTNATPSNLPPPTAFRGIENFVKDSTVTVKRGGPGLGSLDVQLAYFKNQKERRLIGLAKANITREAKEAAKNKLKGATKRTEQAARPKLTERVKKSTESVPADEEEEDIPAEQAALQGEIQINAYQHDPGSVFVRPSKNNRLSTCTRFGENQSLTGRLPGKKKPGRRPRTLPGKKLGKLGPVLQLDPLYLPSIAAHSFVRSEALPRLPAAKPYLPRILRVGPAKVTRPVDFVYPDQAEFYDKDDLEGFRLYGSRHDAVPTARQPGLGIMAPEGLVLDAGSVGFDAEAFTMPRSLGEILEQEAEHQSIDVEEVGSGDEATRFFDEVDLVEAWEIWLSMNKPIVASWRIPPFINHSSPITTWQPADPDLITTLSVINEEEIPVETARPVVKLTQARQLAQKRLREFEDGEFEFIQEQPVAKRRFQSRAKKALPGSAKVASDTTPKLKQRDRRAALAFTEKDYDRLTKAISIVWMLAGGVEGKQNWGIVQHTLSYRYEADFLRHRWGQVKTERDKLQKQVQSKLWEPFLEAYERDELPHVDFTNLENTDWPALLEWAETKVLTADCSVVKTATTTIRSAVPDLPKSIDALSTEFDITANGVPYGPSRDDYFVVLTDKAKKSAAQTYLFGTELMQRTPSPTYDEGVRQLLRTWARAIALTSNELYDLEEAHEKVTQFDAKIVDSVCLKLCAEQVLHLKKIGRRLPGRNYEVHEKFFKIFARWTKVETDFLYLPTIAAKRAELMELLESQDSFELSFTASDAEMIVITNLVAQGMLKIISRIPERNDDFDAPFPKISAWGYSNFNYNARAMDKSRLRFGIVYEKTDSFTFDHGLVADMPIPREPPQFPGEPGLRIPLWVDIHGNILPRVWDLVLRSILHLLVFRPGIVIEQIQASHKDRLGAWEADLVLEWMEATGLAERVVPGREEDGVWKGGWRASEWWYCAFSPDIALWSSAVEGMATDGGQQ